MPLGPLGAAPPAAPARVPVAPGLQAQARLRVLVVRKVLEAALPVFGTDSEEGQAVLAALSALKKFPGDSKTGLLQSEHQALGQAVQPVPALGGGPPPPPPGIPLRPPIPGPGSVSPGSPVPVPG